MNKLSKRIISIVVLLCLSVLLILSLATRKRVSIDKKYYDRDYVALYIFKYHELPKNYYFKSPCDRRKYDNVDVYGGFIHAYDEELPKKVSKCNLKECDVYFEGYNIPDNRGIERLVYTSNTNDVKIFYTKDHYKNYKELTKFNLNITSNVFTILFFTGLAMSITSYILIKKHYANTIAS